MDKTPKVDVKNLPQLRSNTPLFQLLNPNYFGNITDPIISKQYKPVVNLADYHIWYEQLECIGYSPATQTLGAVVNIKQSTGYDGSPCFGGSREYIRFYLDYDRTGVWVDSGLTNFGIYDRNFADVLSYYADIPLDPEQLACCKNAAVLPRVRAILSWNTPPPPNAPNFTPAWGNVLQSDIQLAPNNSIWCYISGILNGLPKVKVDPALLQPDFADKYLPELSEISVDIQSPSPTPAELKKTYAGSVPDARIAHSSIALLTKTPNAVNAAAQLLPGFDLGSIIPIYENPGVDTAWEELGCVGLDRDLSQLNATVIIKQAVGYSGGLCTAGSNEYVAFYMDFGNGWVYMGTSSVAVHDIPRDNPDPLVYDVSLTVNLDAYRQAWCTVGKAKVLAILSWDVAPTPNDPAYLPIFGDSEQATVEVQPLPAGVQPGEIIPVIETIGGMAVTDIDQTNGPTSGLATLGVHSSSIFDGNESPFYGRILITGHIFNPPPGTMYRLSIQTPGTSSLSPLMDTQYIQTDTDGVYSAPITLTPTPLGSPNGAGWMPYYAIGTNVSIVGNLLGIYYTPAGNDGVYKIGIDLLEPSGTIISGTSVIFYVNSEFQIPAVNITTGGGNCSSFSIGNTISGTFSMTNTKFAGGLSLSVTPDNNAVVSILPGTADSLSFALGTLSTDGDSGSFNIDTSQMTVCGYNIRIDTSDRTIIDTDYLGYTIPALQGFCLIKGS